MKYLVIEDDRPNLYGSLSRLVHQGKSGQYSLKRNGYAASGSYFHLEHRLGDPDQEHQTLLDGFLKIKSVPEKDRQYFSIAALQTKFGYQYGRIARPIDDFRLRMGPKLNEEQTQELIDWYSQIDTLMHRLNEIFRIIHPSSDNYDSHGNEIRNLLILACSEVELLFKRLLYDDYRLVKSNMTQFFKSNKLVKLSSYEITFNAYRSLGTIRPFAEWIDDEDYKPLFWYQAYNSTKHGRRFGTDGANLRAVVNAIGACVALLKAQDFYEMLAFQRPPVMDNFKTAFIIKQPNWNASQNYWRAAGRPLKMISGPNFEIG
jgi:hypothetical protein